MVAVAVRTLVLLGCLPLLVPAGVCACQAGAALGLLDPHHDDAGEPGHDGDPCPHCPGATAVAERPAPADPVPDPGDAVAQLAAAAEHVAVLAPTSPVRPSAAWPSAPPLFVSHCALVL